MFFTFSTPAQARLSGVAGRLDSPPRSSQLYNSQQSPLRDAFFATEEAEGESSQAGDHAHGSGWIGKGPSLTIGQQEKSSFLPLEELSSLSEEGLSSLNAVSLARLAWILAVLVFGVFFSVLSVLVIFFSQIWLFTVGIFLGGSGFFGSLCFLIYGIFELFLFWKHSIKKLKPLTAEVLEEVNSSSKGEDASSAEETCFASQNQDYDPTLREEKEKAPLLLFGNFSYRNGREEAAHFGAGRETPRESKDLTQLHYHLSEGQVSSGYGNHPLLELPALSEGFLVQTRLLCVHYKQFPTSCALLHKTRGELQGQKRQTRPRILGG